MEETILEDCNSSEISSSDIEPYTPTLEDGELEHAEDIYSLLEYITLPTPSQSITTDGNKIFAGSKEIIEFDIDVNNFKDFEFKKTNIDIEINRMRYNKCLVCVSDNKLNLYRDHKLAFSLDGNFGYGLYVDDNIFVGDGGNLKIVDFNGNVSSTKLAHKGKMESIVGSDKVVYTCGTDRMVYGYDLRSDTKILSYENNSEVNAIDLGENLVFGDDNGNVSVYDLGNGKVEIIEWQKSPISYLMWRDDIVSCSDEQIAFYDFFDDTIEPKYVRFVHQGQKYYKEVCEWNDCFVSTSIDGLCVFKLAI